MQIYTGFIYEGPAAVKHINQGLIRLMERDGFTSIAEAVGSETKARWVISVWDYWSIAF